MNRSILIIIGIACAAISSIFIITSAAPSEETIALYKLLDSKDVNDRLSALTGLMHDPDKRHAPKIRQCLDDEDSWIQERAIDILIFHLKDKRSIPKLKELLNHKYYRVRSAAEWGLKQLNVPAEEINKAKEEKTNEKVRGLIAQLKDNNRKARIDAILHLDRLNAKEATPEIKLLLQDKDPEIRCVTIHMLTRLDAKDAIPEIKKLLNDNDDSVRKRAEQALRELGVPEEEIKEAKEK